MVEFKEALLQGKAGYSVVSRFNSKGYIIPRRNWLSIATWPIPSHFEEISPEIVVMKRDAEK